MRRALALLICISTVSPSLAVMVVPNPFGDNMVLQRGEKQKVWGWDNPGQGVEVRIAGQIAEGQADSEGRWSVELAPLSAGGPYEMTLSGSETRILKNVLVGEVWLCSGQSNMEFGFRQSDRFEEDKGNFDDESLRLFKVEHGVADLPRAELGGRWTISSAREAEWFSAVALYFARRLREDLGVPVGLIQGAWGGTPIEAWMSRSCLEADPKNRNYLAASEKARLNLASGPFEVFLDDLAWTGPQGRKKFADFDPGTGGLGAGASAGSKSQVETVDLAEPGQGKAARFSGDLALGGWVSLNAEVKTKGKPFDASAYDGFEFRAKGRGPVKLLLGQDSVKDWAFHRTKEIKISRDWGLYQVKFSDLAQPDWASTKLAFNPAELVNLSILRGDPSPPSQPGCLWNGMIAPLAPYAIKGVLWYQGESNAWKAAHYAKEFQDMIQDWRKAWGRDYFFLFVQLANFMGTKVEPGESEWAELRESQARALELPRTGMAVAIDIGNPKDIHPRNKKDVGFRLAAWALADAYGRKGVKSGPLFKGFEVAGKELRLEFNNAESGLKGRNNEEIRGFAVAGEDRVFHWAKARVKGRGLSVSAPEVSQPVAVRYGWDDSPDCNLVNAAGLPASPFRSDSWPGLTADRL